MDIVNMHEAKTRLSQLVEKAARGESFIIAKAGKPIARLGG
jgi:prevent-host-death family protein